MLMENAQKPPVGDDLTLDQSWFPDSVAAISAEWLSHVLQGDSGLGAACVRSVQCTRIGEETGFMGGGLYRLALKYDRPISGVPQSLVAKLSPSDATKRDLLRHANQREVEFYADLGGRSGRFVPRCYYAGFDFRRGTSILLLEDLSALRSVPFVGGCGRGDAETVVQGLADFHALWWENPDLAAIGAATVLADLDLAAQWARYPAALAELLPGANLPERMVEIGNAIFFDGCRVSRAIVEATPHSCLHGDMQLDNALFGVDAPIFLDWQTASKGPGVFDLGYFLISSLDPVLRRDIEAAMIALYHGRLVQQGVADYDLDQCRAGYVHSVVGKFLMTVMATVNLDNSSAGKRQWRQADLTRLAAFCEDHDITAGALH